MKLSGSANAEAEIVIFSRNQVVQMYQLKADVFSRNEVFHSEHLKISRVANATPEITGGANAPREGEVCFKNKMCQTTHLKLPRASNEAPKIYATVIYKTFHQCKLVFFAQVI